MWNVFLHIGKKSHTPFSGKTDQRLQWAVCKNQQWAVSIEGRDSVCFVHHRTKPTVAECLTHSGAQ